MTEAMLLASLARSAESHACCARTFDARFPVAAPTGLSCEVDVLTVAVDDNHQLVGAPDLWGVDHIAAYTSSRSVRCVDQRMVQWILQEEARAVSG